MNACQQLKHRRVAHHTDLVHVADGRLRLFETQPGEPFDLLSDQPLKRLQPPLAFTGVCNPAHHVLAVASLRIGRSGVRQHLPPGQIDQVQSHSRRPHVHGDPQRSLVTTRQDRRDPPFVMRNQRQRPGIRIGLCQASNGVRVPRRRPSFRKGPFADTAQNVPRKAVSIHQLFRIENRSAGPSDRTKRSVPPWISRSQTVRPCRRRKS